MDFDLIGCLADFFRKCSVHLLRKCHLRWPPFLAVRVSGFLVLHGRLRLLGVKFINRVLAFVIYQYAFWNCSVDIQFGELSQYMENNSLVLADGEMIITGRAIIDFKVGDILISEKGSLIYPSKFHLYGREMDFISSAMTCGIISNSVDERLFDGQELFLK
jgi:hypothetical protein